MNTLYPPTPVNVDPSVLAPSASFKKEVQKVVLDIVLFFVVYLLLVLAAVVLAAFCVYAGIMIIVAMPKFITLMLGLGLIALGISVVFFLVKFVFAVQKNVKDARVEITEAEQPRLFEFIRQLTRETQTPFPKKIFLSPDVNACVFYDSSFWSMFLPVKKNLEIGIGLVNALNIGEFKAVMAHEFGHFSQRSMKLGSFTYNVNRIIYNMLYDNSGYTGFLSAWGNIHGLLSIFANITVKIAQAIQWVLQQMYSLINKGYMGLSREMEFHADSIAASVAGSNNMIAALNKVTLADTCYQAAVSRANEWLAGNRATSNLFADQTVVMRFLEKENSYEAEKASRINYKDQWASHPTMTERAAHLQRLNIEASPAVASAWSVFEQPEQLQTEMTKRLYEVAKVEATLTYYNEEEFAARYEAEKEQWQLPEQYMDWFAGRYPDKAVVEQFIPASESLSLEAIISDTQRRLPALLAANEADIQVAEAIAEKRIDVKRFDFDGRKYAASEAAEVVTLLKNEVEVQREQLRVVDEKVLQFLYQQYPDGLAAFRDASEWAGRFNEKGKEVLAIIIPFYNQQGLTIEYINAQIHTLTAEAMPAMKKLWRSLLQHHKLEGDESLQQTVQSFTDKHQLYWYNNQFESDTLNELYDLITKTNEWLMRSMFVAFRRWLQG